MRSADNLLADLLDEFEVGVTLNFSNLGGIYLLKRQDTGQTVVMKEDRSLFSELTATAIMNMFASKMSSLSLGQCSTLMVCAVSPIKPTHAAENNYLFEEFYRCFSVYVAAAELYIQLWH